MIASNCLPRIITVDPSTGCSLTRATIQGMTPSMYEALGTQEIDMHRIITQSREARAAGVIESTLESLLLSKLQNIKPELTRQSIGKNESVILPFIYRRQKRNIQSNYWAVTNVVTSAQAGSNGIPAHAVDITVGNSPSPYASALTNVYKYFLPGKYIAVDTIDATTKASYSLLYKIISAADNGGTSAVVTAVPNISAAGWAALNAGQKAVYNTYTRGLAYCLANSVSDYEQWAYNEVAENTNKLLTFWLQTTRETQMYTDEYLKALNAALTSGYFKDFAQLPLAEQKRIQHMKFLRDWYNTVFYGQQIDENQTPDTYRNLPVVTDPNNDHCTLEYKSNALGLRTLLNNCGRVYDHQGSGLSIDLIAQYCYDLKRAREATGGEITRIDWGTDRFTAGAILQVMTQFYKAKYGVNIERFYKADEELVFNNQVMLKYNVYQLPPDLGGVEFAVWTHQFFDDKLAATQDDIKSRGRVMWGIDWSDFALGIAGTSSAARQTNIYDNLYNTVIKPNITHYMLNSTQFTVMVEDPARHAIVGNFSDATPKLTVPGVDLNA